MADRVEAIHVAASAPSGGVYGEVRGYNQLDIYFSSDFYERSGEAELARRLESLARLLWVEHRRAYEAAVADFKLYPGDRPIESDDDERFLNERAELVATGSSNDGRISVSVRGMRDWHVGIADGTVAQLREAEFLAGLRQAADRMMAHQSAGIAGLRGRIFR
jgi:hypothetical protein